MAYLNPSGSVVDDILQQSQSIPDAIALSQGHRTLTYGQLEAHVSQFAGYLAQSGLGSGQTAALCMERSPEWVIAALSILRTGAAYVPLDLAHPEDRLRFAVQDVGASICVAPQDLLPRIAPTSHGIDPARDANAIRTARPLREPFSIAPDCLAYVIYTSGSTGRPKGVEITHANLSHLVAWHKNAFKIAQGDRVSHLAGLAFDAAVWELWPNLAAGATLCLPEEQVRFSPDLIQQWLLDQRVDVAFVPTVHAEALIRMPWPAGTPLRTLLTGGEALRQGPGRSIPFTVVNNYGPTECTVVATSTVLVPGASDVPPIGQPIDGATLYLLDDDGNQVPDGQVGHLYVGGRGVGRGYRNLPDATSRCFVPDPFLGAPDAVMYCTGDRGIRHADGNVEFRGRTDRQVKIRGHRIELDEIGRALGQHPAVSFAWVGLDGAEEQTPRLVAYLLAHTGSSLPTVAELQSMLLKTLPSYMLPNSFLQLESLALTANGKLDVLGLADKVQGPLPTGMRGSDRDSPLAGKMLSIVRSVLGNADVTAQDDFFLSGGHSLLGMQMILEIRKAFGPSLSIRQLFEAPTADSLTRVVETMLVEEQITNLWRELLSQSEIGLDQNFFHLGGDERTFQNLLERLQTAFALPISELDFLRCMTVRKQAALVCGTQAEEELYPPGVIALQQGNNAAPLFWLHYPCLNVARAMGSGKPYFYVALCGEDLSQFDEQPTLSDIAQVFVAKLTNTQPQGPYNIGGFCLGGILAYEVACQLQTLGHKISSLVMLDTPSPEHYGGSQRSFLNRTRGIRTRIGRDGVRKEVSRLLQRTTRSFSRKDEGKAPVEGEMALAQRLIEQAAARYLPPHFTGDMLLILASETDPTSPSHDDFLSMWQGVVSRNLEYRYVRGTHHALIENPAALEVAEVIASYVLRSEHVLPDDLAFAASVHRRDVAFPEQASAENQQLLDTDLYARPLQKELSEPHISR